MLHGSILAQLASYHSLASLLFAYANEHFPAFAALPRIDMVEAKRRVLLTSMQLDLREPVYGAGVPLKLTFDSVTDKWDGHRLVFFDISVDAAGGKHAAQVGGCFNFRDVIDQATA
ncbi:hypothetical protein [Streptomyces sp. NPDC042319]|uniref:hypothetical protein n=1 Tax=Streptomyces sp. NPDC042319 TaxID=3154332 RepID=UPI0033ECC87E